MIPLSLDFEVLANPVTMLDDTITTRLPDTVVILHFTTLITIISGTI